jgi:hydroxyacylglutathione hydrolase
MRVTPLPILEDNYLYALVASGKRHAALVDPGVADRAIAFLEREGLALEAILLTHHHRDHVGGVAGLLDRFPTARVVGAERDRPRLPRITEAVAEGESLRVLDRDVSVLEVTGHTRGHVAYFISDEAGAGDLFSGDTVFGATIGNLFEGTPEDMFASLRKIRELPGSTRIWCGHEYTLRYVREAARFDPHNAALAERLRRLEAAPANEPTVPLTLDEECRTNPFFRWDDAGLVRRLGATPGVDTFKKLCEVL